MARSSDETNKHGEQMQYDPDFNGPIKNRSCTDILCLLLFLVFLVAWGVVAVLAFKYGDTDKIFLPTDKQNNVCGKGDFADRPVLLFFDLTRCAKVTTLVQGCDTEQVCLSSCPKESYFPELDSTTYEQKLIDVEDAKPIYCKYDVDRNQTVRTLVTRGDCARYVLQSDNVLGRCLPFAQAIKDALFNLKNELNSTQDQNLRELITKVDTWRDVGGSLLEDLQKYWMVIVAGLFLAMLLSFIWIVLMRWIAWIMMWISIILVLGVLGVGCWYCFNRYNKLDTNHHNDTAFEFTSWKTYDQKEVWLGLGITNVVMLVILVLIFIFLRSRICLAIALVEESSKAVGSILSTLFFPIIPFILQCAVIAFGLFIAANISSVTIPTRITYIPPTCTDVCKPYSNTENCEDDDFREKFNSICVSNCKEAKCLSSPFETTWAQAFNLFGMFWAMFFVVGFGQMVLAGAFASWYWTYDKRNVPTLVLINSTGRTIRYHLGSLAFGSLIIAIVKMIRVFLEFVDRKLKEYTDNIVARCIMCCLKCCFWCMENFIKFINRNAYIMIAVHGKNFCSSARNAFQLLMRNIIRVVVLDKVTDFLLFLGKLTIVGCMGLLSFLFFSGEIEFTRKYVADLNYIALPITIICIGSYVIASCFFNVYNMAVDTLFLCFLEDCEKNDGSNEKPYRMSKNLMKILGKKNAKLVEPANK